MEVTVPVLVVVLFLVGLLLATGVRSRRNNSRGGITDRAAAPGAGSGGAQDSDGVEDRSDFGGATDGHGVR